MNKQDIQMKNEVMNRVKSIYYMRTVIRPLLIELGLFVGALIITSFLVSIPNIISNMNASDVNYFSYIASAFLQTRLIVQVVLSLSLVSFIFLIKDLIKNLKHLNSLNFS